ncbi:hypothetical protein I546_3501 [Mycobacterium kansasii 732]|nr:hypothetical protein I546_3501 [Mycobacterium kansasii 732]
MTPVNQNATMRCSQIRGPVELEIGCQDILFFAAPPTYL